MVDRHLIFANRHLIFITFCGFCGLWLCLFSNLANEAVRVDALAAHLSQVQVRNFISTESAMLVLVLADNECCRGLLDIEVHCSVRGPDIVPEC